MKKLKKLLTITLVISMLMSLCTFVRAAELDDDHLQAQKQIEGCAGISDNTDGIAPVYYVWDGSTKGSSSTDPVVYNTDDPATAKVWASKTITPTGTENVFDITLDVWTKNIDTERKVSVPAAVTLVIDVSGSMNSCAECKWTSTNGSGFSTHTNPDTGTKCGSTQNRLDAVKVQSEKFLKSYAGYDTDGVWHDPGSARWVSVVSFTNDGKTEQGWLNLCASDNSNTADGKKDTVDANLKILFGTSGKITKLTPQTYTDTSGGLEQAETLIMDSKISKVADENRYVILLTDGAPFDKTRTDKNYLDTSTDISTRAEYALPSAYVTKASTAYSPGDGSSNDGCTVGYEYGARRAFRIRGTGTNQLNTTLYSIAFGNGMATASAWLNDISDERWEASDSHALDIAFGSIVEKINEIAEPWTVVDPMGEYIEYLGPVSGKYWGNADQADFSSGKNTMTWNLKKATDLDSAAGQTHYQMTYSVKLDVVKLLEDSKALGAGHYYPTNGETVVNYILTESTDAESKFVRDDGTVIPDGANPVLSRDLKVPFVAGYAADMDFVKKLDDGVTALAGAPFKVTSDRAESGTPVWSDTAASGAGGAVSIADIPSGETYKLSETTTTSHDKTVVKFGGSEYEPISPIGFSVAYGTLVDFTNGTVIKNTPFVNKTTVSFTKNWATAVSEIPDSITVKLSREATDVSKTAVPGYESVTIPATDAGWDKTDPHAWVYTFSGGFDKYSSGDYLYTYSVEELNVPAGFKVTGNGTLTLTNTQVVDFTVNKAWIDPAEFSGTHGSVKVDLYASSPLYTGAVAGMTDVDVTAGTPYVFEDLPKYDASYNLITYSVKEQDSSVPAGYIPEYSAVSTDASGNGTQTVTNTYNEDAILVNKVWLNGGEAGVNASFSLYRNGVFQETKTVTSPASSVKFEGLEKFYTVGSDTTLYPYVYTVEEAAISGYTSVYEHEADTSIWTFTNAVEQVSTVAVSGVKEWDGVPAGVTVPDSVTVKLYADGAYTGKSTTATASGGWAYSFTGLDKYAYTYESGVLKSVSIISYTVREDGESGGSIRCGADVYAVTYPAGKIVNTYTETLAYQYDITRTYVHLDYNGNVIGTEVIGPSAVIPGAYNATITANPDDYKICPADGKTYPFDSTDPGNVLSVTLVEDSTIRTYHIDLHYVIKDEPPAEEETTVVSGKKTWDDDSDADGIRPASITIRLLADGAEIDSRTVTEADGWKWSFTGLPKKSGSALISYSVSEEPVPGYETKVTGYNVTNTHVPGTVSVAGSKVWDDDGDAEGLRPASITINLLANGTKIDSKTVTAADGWSWAWNGLAKYSGGAEITYTISEEAVSGYTAAYSGYDVTNTHKAGTVTVAGSKTWDDDGDAEGKRPASITVNLYANGTKIASKTVTEASGWSWEWTGLPKYEGGAAISYAINENHVSGYMCSADGYDLTNTFLTPEKKEELPTPIPGHPGAIDWDGDGIISELDDLFDGDVPLGGVDRNGDGVVDELDDMFDEDIPLAYVARTGDISVFWYICTILSALGLCIIRYEEHKGGKRLMKKNK